MKRNALDSSDSILAEDIAKFPDLNLSESIQRIPGVALSRDEGEGREIQVRGLNSDLHPRAHQRHGSDVHRRRRRQPGRHQSRPRLRLQCLCLGSVLRHHGAQVGLGRSGGRFAGRHGRSDHRASLRSSGVHSRRCPARRDMPTRAANSIRASRAWSPIPSWVASWAFCSPAAFQSRNTLQLGFDTTRFENDNTQQNTGAYSAADRGLLYRCRCPVQLHRDPAFRIGGL